MPLPSPVEKWPGKIEEVTIGATKGDGGTRSRKIVIGGEKTLPFLHFDGDLPHPPVVAMEIQDTVPDWPGILKNRLGKAVSSPTKWAQFCESAEADMVCLRLKGADPDGENRKPEDIAETVASVLKATGLPLVISGCGNEEKDAKVFQACGEIIRNERCAIGSVDADRYKSLASISMAYDQNIIAFSNIDVNLAKQINILLSDFGVKKSRIIMDPLMGGLGYGLDYSYSVNERIRLAALQGDAMLQMPIICDAGVAWSAAEATNEERDDWGDVGKRGTLWEATTALSAVLSGADILIMRDPDAVKIIRGQISALSKRGD